MEGDYEITPLSEGGHKITPPSQEGISNACKCKELQKFILFFKGKMANLSSAWIKKHFNVGDLKSMPSSEGGS